jgi:hypothetical protein
MVWTRFGLRLVLERSWCGPGMRHIRLGPKVEFGTLEIESRPITWL